MVTGDMRFTSEPGTVTIGPVEFWRRDTVGRRIDRHRPEWLSIVSPSSAATILSVSVEPAFFIAAATSWVVT